MYVNVSFVEGNPHFIIYDIIDSVSGKIVRNDGSLSDIQREEFESIIIDMFMDKYSNFYLYTPVAEFGGSINYSGQKASYILQI